MHGLGFDDTNTMSGHISGVQIRLKLHAPSSIYVHCRCHKLQLAALNAASEHTVVKRILGTLLTIWKAFHFSPKKAEKLAEIQAELQAPEIKMQKPSDTRWLVRGRAVSVVRRRLPDVLHIVVKLQGSLQAKDVDLASVPSMVASTTKRLLELKEDVTSSTWFKEHSLVFTHDAQLGEKHIVVLEEEKTEFFTRCIDNTSKCHRSYSCHDGIY
ncbi:E3 SUMO-protein ligase [Oopsacas minuta]|uniref:E3 SUMO-protein ligase n=1 Tax=Oopsacas minuta TaxID=111878 RepID=A0AAV7JVQ9_9METZ|nr:E3 SUMO-protein ligase [Oopsacas minuta]KAI6653016.1 E3 SUMO-protein ligase [Oopsacas minuta]